MAALSYRELAAKAHADADAATLDNVRDRCLRAEAAWLAMADRQDRTEDARAAREAKTIEAASPGIFRQG
jgi:hypothetical protein